MRRIQVNKPLFSIPLISPSENIRVDLEIYFFLTSEMIPRLYSLCTLYCGSLMKIEIKCRVRTHESDSEVTVQNNTKDLFCSIRSQHSHKGLEMVWRDSFPRGSFTFIENLCAMISARFTSVRPD